MCLAVLKYGLKNAELLAPSPLFSKHQIEFWINNSDYFYKALFTCLALAYSLVINVDVGAPSSFSAVA